MFVMMLQCKRILFFVLILLFTGIGEAVSQTQDGGNENGGSGTEAPSSKAARRKAKQEWKDKRRKDFADQKARKEYRKQNTKKTQERMKKSERIAKRNNEHRKEFFLIRWIKKRRK